MPDEAYDRVMNGNVRSNFWLANMVAPQMAERGDGVDRHRVVDRRLPGLGPARRYCISKAADIQLARNIAVEWGDRNVRANCIAPGLIRTDFARALWENPVILGKAVETAPLQRIGEPDEIAGAAVFLASRAGSFMTGQTMVIDGGRLAGSPRGE